MSATGYKPGDLVYVEFTTQAFATGMATNADSTPTGILNRNGTDVGAVTVTVTNLDTGRYKAVFTIPIGYVPGDVLNLTIAATVGGVSGKAAVWHTKLVAAGVILADGVTHGGPAAILALERVAIEATTPAEPALKLTSLSGMGLHVSSYNEGIYVTSENADVVQLYGYAQGAFTINIRNEGCAAAINLLAVGSPALQINALDTTAISMLVSGFGFYGVDIVTPDMNSYGIKSTLAPITMANFFGIDSENTYTDAVPGSVVKEIADNAAGSGGSGGSGPTAQEIADQITADHGAGSYVTPDLSGSGNITVNHDYGGADNLAYKTGAGIGIDNAEILVYLKSDYDAGNQTTAHVKGRAATDVNGRWTRSLLLDAADYTFVYAKQGAYGPDVREVTVA